MVLGGFGADCFARPVRCICEVGKDCFSSFREMWKPPDLNASFRIRDRGEGDPAAFSLYARARLEELSVPWSRGPWMKSMG